jgi:hypothetical protein
VVSFAEHTISMVAVALRDWRRSSRPTDAPGFGLEEKDGLREVISRLMA